MRYAAGDVAHLARLRNTLADRLRRLERTRWVREECERMERLRHSEPDREGAFLAVKGSRALDGRGLAVSALAVPASRRAGPRVGQAAVQGDVQRCSLERVSGPGC